MKLEILDTYKEIKKDGQVLHPHDIIKTVVKEVSEDEANKEFLDILNKSKVLSDNVVVNVVKEYKNYADLTITLDDGREFKRIIYTI